MCCQLSFWTSLALVFYSKGSLCMFEVDFWFVAYAKTVSQRKVEPSSAWKPIRCASDHVLNNASRPILRSCAKALVVDTLSNRLSLPCSCEIMQSRTIMVIIVSYFYYVRCRKAGKQTEPAPRRRSNRNRKRVHRILLSHFLLHPAFCHRK